MRALLRFCAPFLFFVFSLAVLTRLPIVSHSNSLEKRRKRPEDTTGTMEIGNEKSKRYNTQARILRRRSLFSILFALSAVFLDREIVVRRFIYARSAKFTGCVAGAVLINHAVRFKRSWREERQRVSSLFHRSTTGLYLSHVSAIFAKRHAPENGC